MQVQEKKAGRREGGGGRGGSLLKQQANTWACVPLISKCELVALMLCQVVISQRNSRGRFAVQGREEPMSMSEAQLWSHA